MVETHKRKKKYSKNKNNLNYAEHIKHFTVFNENFRIFRRV